MTDDNVVNEIRARGDNRSHIPTSKEFRDFIGTDWGERPPLRPRMEVADWLAARHAQISERFAGIRLVIPAGSYKTRSNDTSYRFRAHSAFSHMTGLGAEMEPDAVLVLNPVGSGESAGHEATLYFHPQAPRDSEEFYKDSQYGEFWVGARATLEEMSQMTGLRCDSLDNLGDALAKDLGTGHVQMFVVPQADARIEAQVQKMREAAGLPNGSESDLDLLEALAEIRLRKDEWEVGELRKAVAATYSGFDNIIRSIPAATTHWRGERMVEGAFGQRAREEGNGLGYDTIAAAGNHANTLHYIGNDGPLVPGELILVDAGVEVDSLYTADITRTLPISGKFSETQAEVYQAVLDAANHAFEVAGQSGCRFRDIHAAAMEVIAARLEAWGLLPGTAEESLKAEVQWHRRWMPHGTSHHLGLDVHDCAQARREMYMDALLEPGMCFTIEPGLYFRADDLKVPERFRGIGVRIEDDVLVTNTGVERLSEAIPREIADVEAWMARIWAETGDA